MAAFTSPEKKVEKKEEKKKKKVIIVLLVWNTIMLWLVPYIVPFLCDYVYDNLIRHSAIL